MLSTIMVGVEREKSHQQSSRKVEWIVWGALLLTILVIVVAFARSRTNAYHPEGASSRPGQIDLRPIAQLPDFTLTNQDAHPVSLADLRGNVWVGDIVFTRCAGPCPVMTQRMSELQALFPPAAPVKLVTLTTDPEFDQPPQLKAFGERFKANFASWNFLTGTKAEIARVAADGMKLAAVEKNPAERESVQDLFIHSTLFVLVDKQGRLRGSIQSGDPQMKQKVLTAVNELLSEQ